MNLFKRLFFGSFYPEIQNLYSANNFMGMLIYKLRSNGVYTGSFRPVANIIDSSRELMYLNKRASWFFSRPFDAELYTSMAKLNRQLEDFIFDNVRSKNNGE